MPRITAPCEICGREVDFGDWQVHFDYNYKTYFLVICKNRDRCDRHWSRWDRILYGKRHEVKMDVERVATDIFRVRSESAHDKTYSVDMSVPNCSCTDWATKRNKMISAARAAGKPDSSVTYRCKHINEIAAYHMDDPIQDDAAKLQKERDAIVAEYVKDETKADLIKTFEELRDA